MEIFFLKLKLLSFKCFFLCNMLHFSKGHITLRISVGRYILLRGLDLPEDIHKSRSNVMIWNNPFFILLFLFPIKMLFPEGQIIPSRSLEKQMELNLTIPQLRMVNIK